MRNWLAACVAIGSSITASAEPLTIMNTAESKEDVVSRRISLEDETRDNAWVITPMRPNYIMPVTYASRMNTKPWENAGLDPQYDDVEVKFQISLKLAIWEDIWSPNSALYFGYTQISVWQAYNSSESSPFRDTNYEPEFFITMNSDRDVFGLTHRSTMFGAVHQSNGRGSESLSRSWNRLYVNVVLERGNFALAIKPWYRIPEKDEDDDNPHMEKYLGYGEVRVAYKHDNHLFAAMGRNNLRSDGNKGALEIDWSFPLGRVRGFVQYFVGYGETLLDYDFYQQRIGVGVLLSDWL